MIRGIAKPVRCLPPASEPAIVIMAMRIAGNTTSDPTLVSTKHAPGASVSRSGVGAYDIVLPSIGALDIISAHVDVLSDDTLNVTFVATGIVDSTATLSVQVVDETGAAQDLLTTEGLSITAFVAE